MKKFIFLLIAQVCVIGNQLYATHITESSKNVEKVVTTSKNLACLAGTDVPLLSGASLIITPPATADLTTITASNTPAGTTLTWYEDLALTTQVATPNSVTANVYYASFYDATNACNSPAIRFDVFNDSDGDTVIDDNDLDDDNDGILDIIENPCEKQYTFNTSAQGWYVINDNNNGDVQSNPASHSTDSVTSGAGCTITTTGAANTNIAGLSPTGTHYLVDDDSTGGYLYVRSPDLGGVDFSNLIGGTFTYDAYNYQKGGVGTWTPGAYKIVHIYNTSGNVITAQQLLTSTERTNWENGIWNTTTINMVDAEWSGTATDLNNVLSSVAYISIRVEFINGGHTLDCATTEYFALDNITFTNSGGGCDNDTDGDGIPNHLDLDSDNDGIPDVIEVGGTDANGDGKVDTTVGVDGIPTGANSGLGYPSLNSDGDALANYLDLDSDNDGISDLTEANNPNTIDADNDGKDDGAVGNDGIPNNAQGGTDGGAVPQVIDTDNDTQFDFLDLDSDNDGITDVKESGSTASDTDNDGMIDSFTDADGNGIDDTHGVVATPTNSDGDSGPIIPDYRDLDADNDGINDTDEVASISDIDGNGMKDDFSQLVSNPGVNYTTVSGTVITGADADNDGIVGDADLLPAIYGDAKDTDGDGVIDSLDLDSDNDGILDTEEGKGCVSNNAVLDWDAHYTPGTSFSTGDDPVAVTPILTINGVQITMSRTFNTSTHEYRVNNTMVNNYNYVWYQNGNVGAVSNHSFSFNKAVENLSFTIYDLDKVTNIEEKVQLTIHKEDGSLYTLAPADYTIVSNINYIGSNTFVGTGASGNSNPNKIEFTFSIPVRSVTIAYTDNINGGNIAAGMSNISFCTPLDTDNDGIPNYLDLDSDNDGIADVIEAGGEDADGDGVAGTGISVNASGVPTVAGATGYTPVDTDADTTPDYLDLDSDNDGITDLAESGTTATDTDNNGMIDGFTDVDNNGVDDTAGLVTNPTNSDTDSGSVIYDFRDLDADNDGINDVEEAAGGVDANGDGLKDDINTLISNPGTAYITNSGTVITGADTDNDGIVGTADGLPTVYGDDKDSDGDGISDTADLDSDNDGILDADEGKDCTANTNTLNWNDEYTAGTTSFTTGDDPVATTPVLNIGGTQVTLSRTANVTGDFRINSAMAYSVGYTLYQEAKPYAESKNTFTFNKLVNNVSFTVLDLDKSTTLDEKVKVNFYKYDGSILSLQPSDYTITSSAVYEGGNTFGSTGVSNNSSPNKVVFHLSIPINKIEVEFYNDHPVGSSTSGMAIALSNMSFCVPIDSDNDGVPNYLDLDSDNDGIPDVIEAGGVDGDGDGIVGTGVPVVNGSGVPTTANGGAGYTPIDTDGDNEDDYYDLDSDNDGITDIKESGNTTVTDTNNDGMIDGFTDVDKNGVDDSVTLQTTPTNTDGDSGPEIPDYRDLDSDNDGINDVIEASGGVDLDNNGQKDDVSILISNPGTAYTTITGSLVTGADPDNDGILGTADALPTLFGDDTDTDGDGVGDTTDLDSDNDGVLDSEEGKTCSPSNTLTLDWNEHYTVGTNTSTGDDPVVTKPNITIGDVEVTLSRNSNVAGSFRVNTGYGVVSYSLYKRAQGTAFSTHTFEFSKAVNNLNFTIRDIDHNLAYYIDNLQFEFTRNDGTKYALKPTDYVITKSGTYEGSNTFKGTASEPNTNPSILEITVPVDVKKMVIYYTNNHAIGSTSFMGIGITNLSFCVPTDSDGDGVPNYLDLDSDNDGISDVAEAGGSDPDNDGIAGAGTPTVTSTGIPDVANSGTGYIPVDTDGDGVKNYVDLDSDNDGINDVEEATGGVDVNGDGFTDATGTVTSTAGTDYITVSGTVIVGSDPDNDGILGTADGLPAEFGDAIKGDVIISQVYHDTNVRVIEVTNYGTETVAANVIKLALFKNRNGESGTPDATYTLTSALSSGQSAIIRSGALAGITVNASPSGAAINVVNTAITDFADADDTIILSGSTGETAWENRYDVASAITNETSYVRVDEVAVPNTTYTASEWTAFIDDSIPIYGNTDPAPTVTRSADVPLLSEVKTPNPQANNGLGLHRILPTNRIAGAWSNGYPDRSRYVIVQENYEHAVARLSARKLEVQGTNALAINNQLLVVSNNVTIADNATIRIIGTGQFVQTHSGISNVTGNGKLLIEQKTEVPNVYRYNYWSSPVVETANGTTYRVEQVMKDGTTQISATSPITNIDFITGYDGGTGSPIKISNYWIWTYFDGATRNDWVQKKETGTINKGLGYTMKSTGATPQYFTFAGSPIDGEFSYTITGDKTSLLGNPYAGTLDADAFILQNKGAITGTLYFWEHSGKGTGESHNKKSYEGGYAQRNFAMGTAANYTVEGTAGLTGSIDYTYKVPSRYIAVGQGFFVSSDADGGTVTFNNKQRSYQATAPDFFRSEQKKNASKTASSTTTELPIIKLGFAYLNKNGIGIHRQLGVSFNTNNSFGFEYGYDSEMLDVQPTDMYFDFPEIENKKMVIAGVESIYDDMQIPLTLTINTTESIYVMIDELEFVSHKTYLYDSVDDVSYPLSKETAVALSLPKGLYETRFFLTFKEQGTVLSANNELLEEQTKGVTIFMNNTTQKLLIGKEDAINITKVKAYNLLGQEVKEWAIDATKNINVLTTLGLASSVYIVKVTTNKGVVSKKIIKK